MHQATHIANAPRLFKAMPHLFHKVILFISLSCCRHLGHNKVNIATVHVSSMIIGSHFKTMAVSNFLAIIIAVDSNCCLLP